MFIFGFRFCIEGNASDQEVDCTSLPNYGSSESKPPEDELLDFYGSGLNGDWIFSISFENVYKYIFDYQFFSIS